jgi:hypothetical protein
VRAKAGGGEDAAVVSEPGEFSLDAAMTPARVLPREPDDQFTEFGVDG